MADCVCTKAMPCGFHAQRTRVQALAYTLGWKLWHLNTLASAMSWPRVLITKSRRSRSKATQP